MSTISSHGYELVFVGKNHHLADVRGYVYKHRLVAEEKLGRKLLPNEIVHHINGIKLDNRPENLDIVKSVAYHRLKHRTRNSNLRKPGEDNPIILCSCGCSTKFSKYDSLGRPRLYISGHNPPPPATTQNQILNELKNGPIKLSILIANHGSKSAVLVACKRLIKKGLVIKIERGLYGRK